MTVHLQVHNQLHLFFKPENTQNVFRYAFCFAIQLIYLRALTDYL